MMTSGNLEALRRVNHSLRSATGSLRAEQTQCGALRPQDLTAILEMIQSGAASIQSSGRSPDRPADPEYDREVSAYRQNLEALRDLLPDLHSRLLAERSRLESSLAHLSSATAWVRASRKTL